MYNNLFLSPLEQFQVLPLISLRLGVIDISITNVALIVILSLAFVGALIALIFSPDKTLKLFPHAWQAFFEKIYILILSLVSDNIKSDEAQRFFPLIFTTFFFVLVLNLTGMVPYSFTLTSHIIVTFTVSLAMFIGINIVTARRYGIKMFSLFLPPGTSTVLAFLLVPIEFLSYTFKPISLSIRLFANMMAGHTLLKVIVGFAFVMSGFGGVIYIGHFVPLFLLIPLFALEVGVALIQAFVFSVLISIYINDALNLH